MAYEKPNSSHNHDQDRPQGLKYQTWFRTLHQDNMPKISIVENPYIYKEPPNDDFSSHDNSPNKDLNKLGTKVFHNLHNPSKD